MTKKPAPPTDAEYRIAKSELLAAYAPPIAPCPVCKWPKMEGYVCQFCKFYGRGNNQ